jgi:plasmid stabilization system protein ParE
VSADLGDVLETFVTKLVASGRYHSPGSEIGGQDGSQVMLVVAAEAEADLEHIAAYVAEQSPRSALTLVRELRERCQSLQDARVATLGAALRASRHSTTSLRPVSDFLPRQPGCDLKSSISFTAA